jgi:hypothetical protein
MRRVVVFVVGLLVLQATPAGAAAPDVVRQQTCSDGARSRLELTDIGDQIKVRFEVHRSPVGHEWRIRIRHGGGIMGPNFDWLYPPPMVAGDSGDFVVQLRTRDREDLVDSFMARATDTQTGQRCGVWARI